MTAAVRALSLLLVVWLTAAASFPPCCWSMAGPHDHQTQQHASGTSVQPHAHHHGSVDTASLAASAPSLSAVPSHNCDTESIEAIASPRAAFSSIDRRAADAGWADAVVTQVSAAWRERPDSAPPGGSSASAFLNPLRV